MTVQAIVSPIKKVDKASTEELSRHLTLIALIVILYFDKSFPCAFVAVVSFIYSFIHSVLHQDGCHWISTNL